MARFCKHVRESNVYGCGMRDHYLLHDTAGHPQRPPVADEGRKGAAKTAATSADRYECNIK